MMRACKYPKVMWRCYEPAFYGGRYAEGTQGDQLYDSTGTAEFMRAPFPGLPFRGESEADAPAVASSTAAASLRHGAPDGVPSLGGTAALRSGAVGC
jgi:hypothetical protein